MLFFGFNFVKKFSTQFFQSSVGSSDFFFSLQNIEAARLKERSSVPIPLPRQRFMSDVSSDDYFQQNVKDFSFILYQILVWNYVSHILAEVWQLELSR